MDTEQIALDGETTERDLKAGIKDFLHSHFTTPQTERTTYGIGEFDLSNPQTKDVDGIASGEFQIRDLTTRKDEKGDIAYHFYVGGTEVDISGQAARDLECHMRVTDEGTSSRE